MKIYYICLVGWLLMFSCNEDLNSYPVGTDFIDNDINITIIDSFSIEAGTFKLDSLVTSGTSRILLGSVKNDYFGHLTAQSYFQLSNSYLSISTDAVYDSIGMVLNYDTYHYGDTTQIQSYKVHRLLEYFEPEDGDNFYNLSKLEYESNALGELTFTPRPNSTADSLYIPLDDELGAQIFNKIQNDEINDTEDFVNYFKGVTVISDTLSNSHVLGFSFKAYSDLLDNSSMRLYYTEDIDDGSEGNNQVMDFYITSTSKQFNTITTNLEGTTNQNLSGQESSVSSHNSDALIFAQAGTGISARIEMPTLKDLKKLSDNNTTLQAKLTFRPLANSYNNARPLKDSLAVYVIDQKNRIINQLTDLDSSASYAILNQNEDEFNQNTYYSIDMSGFVETILASEYDLNYAIMIQFIDYSKTVDSVVIDDFNENNNNIQLSIAYLNY